MPSTTDVACGVNGMYQQLVQACYDLAGTEGVYFPTAFCRVNDVCTRERAVQVRVASPLFAYTIPMRCPVLT